MRVHAFYDERLKKKIKKVDNGTKVILKKWIEKFDGLSEKSTK